MDRAEPRQSRRLIEFKAIPARGVPGFSDLDPVNESEILWRKVGNGQGGRFWMAVDRDGVHWVYDGRDRIAAAVEKRIMRFFYYGIAARLATLRLRYLRDLIAIPRHSLIVNFGANIGELAVALTDLGGFVIAVEPDPNVLAALSANARGRMIEPVPVAVWRVDEPVKLYLNSQSADTSVFPVSDEAITVDGRTIDSLIAERGIERVHLIIGDAEGAEPEVLEGARKTLPITSYVSVNASAERQGERTLEACEAILTDAGFDTIHRDDSGFCMLIARNRREGR